MHYNVFFLR